MYKRAFQVQDGEPNNVKTIMQQHGCAISQSWIWFVDASLLVRLRGHFQTNLGKINVIMTLGGKGLRSWAMTLILV